MEEKCEKPGEEETSVEILKDIQNVLKELVGEKSLEMFRVEYKKLFTALKKSYENEKRLMTKCQELSAEISSNAVKIASTLKQSQEAQATSMSLKQENRKALEALNTAREKETTTNDKIKSLQEEKDRLTELLEQRDIWENQSVGYLLKINEQLTAERDKLLSELVTLRDNFRRTTTKQHEAEDSNMKAQETILQLQHGIQVSENECSRKTYQKARLEKELKQLRADVEAQQLEIKTLTTQLQHCDELKVLKERLSKDLEKLQKCNTKLQHENEQKLRSLEQLTKKNKKGAAELKIEREEVGQTRQEIAKLARIKDTTQKKLRLMEDQKLEVEQQRDIMKNQITGLKKEMEMAQKHTESDKKLIEKLIQEKDMLNKREAVDMNRKMKSMSQENGQLTKGIRSKEADTTVDERCSGDGSRKREI